MAGSPQHEALRSLPQVEELLRDARLQQIAAILPRNVVVEAARTKAVRLMHTAANLMSTAKVFHHGAALWRHGKLE